MIENARSSYHYELVSGNRHIYIKQIGRVGRIVDTNSPDLLFTEISSKSNQGYFDDDCTKKYVPVDHRRLDESMFDVHQLSIRINNYGEVIIAIFYIEMTISDYCNGFIVMFNTSTREMKIREKRYRRDIILDSIKIIMNCITGMRGMLTEKLVGARQW